MIGLSLQNIRAARAGARPVPADRDAGGIAGARERRVCDRPGAAIEAGGGAGEDTTPPFAALVLVDITPQLEEAGVARVVGFMRERLEDGFASLEEAADAIAAYLPHRPADPSGLAKVLRRHPDGRFRWHWDPRFVTNRKHLPKEIRESHLEAAARRLTMPTLLVRGRMSELVSEEAARAFLALAPHAHYADVTEVGHMVAGDRNDAFIAAVTDFLGRADGPGRPAPPHSGARL